MRIIFFPGHAIFRALAQHIEQRLSKDARTNLRVLCTRYDGALIKTYQSRLH